VAQEIKIGDVASQILMAANEELVKRARRRLLQMTLSYNHRDEGLNDIRFTDVFGMRAGKEPTSIEECPRDKRFTIAGHPETTLNDWRIDRVILKHDGTKPSNNGRARIIAGIVIYRSSGGYALYLDVTITQHIAPNGNCYQIDREVIDLHPERTAELQAEIKGRDWENFLAVTE
jgi:hypothetical protein